ncbi:hypothetical protein LINPERHAP1_LOCUS7647, partial [Linum perenne]
CLNRPKSLKTGRPVLAVLPSRPAFFAQLNRCAFKDRSDQIWCRFPILPVGPIGPIRSLQHCESCRASRRWGMS